MKDQTDAISFAQFVEYGRSVSPNEALVNGVPWHFEYKDHPVTHERDDLYLIGNGTPQGIRFHLGHILVTSPSGKLFTVVAP